MKRIPRQVRFISVSLLILPLLAIGFFFSLSVKNGLAKHSTPSQIDIPELATQKNTATIRATPEAVLTQKSTSSASRANPVTISATPTMPWLGTPDIEADLVEVDCPILLYHHVTKINQDDRYSVSKAEFKKQMQALKDAEYQAIPMSSFVSALLNNVALPEKSIVITFDDGYADVYENAFPVLKEIGWPATVYLIVDMMDEPNQISYDQAKDLINSGWEIGSHTMSHANLTKADELLLYEVENSKFILENRLGVQVDTIAYPYGEQNESIDQTVEDAGYFAGMGIGLPTHHKKTSRFFLSRLEVTHEMTIEKLLGMLTWH